MKRITEKQRAAVWGITQGEDTANQPKEVQPLGLIVLESIFVKGLAGKHGLRGKGLNQ